MRIDDLTPEEEQFETQRDKAWRKIFSKLNLLETIESEDIALISAKDIKQISKKEPRILSKIDCSDSLPSIFKKNHLCILQANRRGEYTIGRFDAFTKLDYECVDCVRKQPPNETYKINNPLEIHREPDAILTAFNYGLFSDILNLESNSDLKMVSFGRRGTEQFDFNVDILNEKGNKVVNSHNIKVNNTQIELGGVFEDPDNIIIVETKLEKRDDFITRQLYYPYRALADISEKAEKTIYNVFLTASNGSIYTHVYKVEDKMSYNSMRQINCARYDFFKPISISDIREVLNRVQIVDENSDTIFPQADNMDRIFETLKIVKEKGGISAAEIGLRMGLTGRQGGYYSNACLYLELLKRTKCSSSYAYFLTDFGNEMLNKPWKERNMMMVEAIARHNIFNYFIRQYLDNQERPERTEIIKWLGNNIGKMNTDNETPSRRAATVLGWMDWIIQITDYDNGY